MNIISENLGSPIFLKFFEATTLDNIFFRMFEKKIMESVRKERKHSYQHGVAYGRLILTGRNYLKHMYGQQRRIVEADCVCGNVKWYLFDSLIKGATKSCGCLQKELTSKRFTVHGMRKHPLYSVYRGMIERCYDKRNIGYPLYGGRGITVCDEWLDSPKVFLDWALANGWQNGLDIDRRENNGNYEPSNCRFVPPGVNNRNRRTGRFVTAFGERKCLTDWSEDPRCKVAMKTIWRRLNEDGWNSIEEMITTPPKKRGFNIRNRATNKKVTAFGEEKSIADWLKDARCVADEKRLRLRLRKGINQGWTPEKALTTHIRKLPVIESAR